MKRSLLLASFPLLCLLSPLRSFGEPPTQALLAADTQRIEAMTHPERSRLGAVFSDELRYAHSNGVVDSKASFTEVLLEGRTKYLSYQPLERNFTFPAPHIALMTGRAQVKVATPSGEMDATLSYLAVWREEAGQWKFLAWQSCKLPARQQ